MQIRWQNSDCTLTVILAHVSLCGCQLHEHDFRDTTWVRVLLKWIEVNVTVLYAFRVESIAKYARINTTVILHTKSNAWLVCVCVYLSIDIHGTVCRVECLRMFLQIFTSGIVLSQVCNFEEYKQFKRKTDATSRFLMMLLVYTLKHIIVLVRCRLVTGCIYLRIGRSYICIQK